MVVDSKLRGIKERLKEHSTWTGLATLAFIIWYKGGDLTGVDVPSILSGLGLIFVKEAV